MNSFTDFVVISRVEYDCLKKTVSSKQTEPKRCVNAREELIKQFPSKFQHVVVKLIEQFESESEIFLVTPDYGTLKLVQEPYTFNLLDTLRVLLYEHTVFSEEDYKPFKKAFNAAKIPFRLIINNIFAQYLKKPILVKKRKALQKTAWLNYGKFKTC